MPLTNLNHFDFINFLFKVIISLQKDKISRSQIPMVKLGVEYGVNQTFQRNHSNENFDQLRKRI